MTKYILLLFMCMVNLFANAQMLEPEARFVDQTAHLDFNAPQSCRIEIDIEGKRTRASYGLGKDSCIVLGSEQQTLDSQVAQNVELMICAMLVPALNTSGKDLFSLCKSKSNVDGKVIFKKCGPRHDAEAELNLKELTVSIYSPTDNTRFIKNSYVLMNKKLFPTAVEFRKDRRNLKIEEIHYTNEIPSKLKGKADAKVIQVSFSKCIKNH